MRGSSVVATVLVSNNQHGLDHVLLRLSRQTMLPHRVVVVDNASRKPVTVRATLDCTEVPVDLVRLETNLGVGGGHNTAIRRALDAHLADVVLVLEHDTFLDDTCLEKLIVCSDVSPVPCVVVTTLVRNNYERRWLDLNQAFRPTTKFLSDKSARFTLNGVLIPREVIESTGYLREDFFVGQEDWEYSSRVTAAGFPIFSCTTAIAIHANKGDHRFAGFLSPIRLYYSERNLLATVNTNRLSHLKLMTIGFLKAVAEMFTRGRGWRFAAARAYATRDGLMHRLGPKSYLFMKR